MNILYIFGGEKAQGAEIVIERLINRNAAHVNSHLLLSPGHYANQLMSANKPYSVDTLSYLKKLNRSSSTKISYIFLALRNYFFVPFKVYSAIKSHHINIVHVNTIVPSSYLTLLVIYTRLFKPSIKWIWSDHDLRYFTRLEMILAKICVWCYHKTLVVSKAVAEKYKNSNQVTVLYNGLDINEFRSCKKSRSIFRQVNNVAEQYILIGIAGVIHESKGQLALIQVFKQLFLRYENIKLVIAGDFAAQTPTYSEEVAQQMSNNTGIIYLGYTNKMQEFFNGCDIIVSNSNNFQSESLGTTMYEAMACEKIVIGSNTGGTPEIITDGVDGFLVTPEDQSSLLSKLEFVISNFNALGNVQKNAREKTITKFNMEIMVSKYNELLATLHNK